VRNSTDTTVCKRKKKPNNDQQKKRLRATNPTTNQVWTRGKCLNLIWSLYIKKLGIFYLSVSNLSNLRIFYLFKILANGIGHKLLQQLFKTVSYNLQQTIYITHITLLLIIFVWELFFLCVCTVYVFASKSSVRYENKCFDLVLLYSHFAWRY
jgi:hypothetical protein